jgi:H+-transporting ATPase
MTPLGWKWAGFVWAYALLWFFVTDPVKLLAYRIFDPVKAETKPGSRSEDKSEAKKDTKPDAKASQKPDGKTEPKPAAEPKPDPKGKTTSDLTP